MGKPNTTCRVCGKGYFCCADSRAANSWRTMACSPECYKEYMRRVWDARQEHDSTADASMETGKGERVEGDNGHAEGVQRAD